MAGEAWHPLFCKEGGKIMASFGITAYPDLMVGAALRIYRLVQRLIPVQ